MSAQFGRWNFDGRPVDPGYLEKAGSMLAPYGPDSEGAYIEDNVAIVFHAFHTTQESRREKQPHVTSSGAVLTWDGRLDNRPDLTRELRGDLTAGATDVEIVAAAYERWGIGCFARLIGDWALTVWDPKDRSLVLAKDPIGARHLYYSLIGREVTWSTILDPLVLLAEKIFALDEEYIAGWFSLFPSAHLTPYVGVHSVPPCSSILIRDHNHAVRKYWDFDPCQTIRYRTDAEYEEHFRGVFAEAVRRRLRSDTPVLAELSGGMDSSAIVCMADSIVARGIAETRRLDTVSYYDDSEPNWNELPYLSKVEEKRGRVGCHIDMSSREFCQFGSDNGRFAAIPGAGDRPDQAAKQYAACVESQENRVVLSGIGGDEVMGGVPTPTPELEDLLARGQIRMLAHQLKVWALNKRKPWFHLLFDAMYRFFPLGLVGVTKEKRPASWISPGLARRNRAALRAYERRLRLFGPLPSFQENIGALDALRRQLACSVLPSGPLYEKRYPYLDRSLLEFIFAIPRDQLVRPGQRRSLMRRALVGIVPDELLNRKRKAFVARGPMTAISTQYPKIVEMSEHMVATSLGIIEPKEFLEVLQKARDGREILLVALMRTLYIEAWLRNLRDHALLSAVAYRARELPTNLATNTISAEKK